MTTFLLPQGKFRYLRAPMGLNASSDEWCCQSDVIIEGLDWARKIVDDTLIWAEDMEELMRRTRIVLERCRKVGITISKKKLELGNKIQFAGHIISDEGIQPDEEKYKAIKDFPRPKNLKDTRAFLGLANQLGAFIPDLAHMTSPLRPLIKKGNAWLWLEEHEKCFNKVKELLTSKTLVQPFNEAAETFMLTDASRLNGLGFALMQRKDGEHTLVQCGSCSLTPTQQRYATIELECLAIQWSIKKCEFYLKGLDRFEVLTDHRPLVGIFSKQLNALENSRLMRMREKLTEYSFEVKWVEGKSHYIADALSRAPVFDPHEEELTVDCAINCLRVTDSKAISILDEIRGEEYKQLINCIISDRELKDLPPDHPARKYKEMGKRISCLLYTSPSPRDLSTSRMPSSA